MTLRSTSDSSILENGKLKPGIYKIQNIHNETYLDIEVLTREMCCRPAEKLGEGRGFWEIKNFGAGYTIRMVDPGKPEQFCTLREKLGGYPLAVTAYPVAWRADVVDDDKRRGSEYIHFCWGDTKWGWGIPPGFKNGTKIFPWVEHDGSRLPRQMWKLIPVKDKSMSTPPPLSEVPDSGSLPLYDGDATEQDKFGTIVNEVTVVTTNSTVTTRKRYRAGDA